MKYRMMKLVKWNGCEDQDIIHITQWGKKEEPQKFDNFLMRSVHNSIVSWMIFFTFVDFIFYILYDIYAIMASIVCGVPRVKLVFIFEKETEHVSTKVGLDRAMFIEQLLKDWINIVKSWYKYIITRNLRCVHCNRYSRPIIVPK